MRCEHINVHNYYNFERVRFQSERWKIETGLLCDYIYLFSIPKIKNENYVKKSAKFIEYSLFRGEGELWMNVPNTVHY